jgi:hypothetical protein
LQDSPRQDHFNDRVSGLEDKVDVLEDADEDGEKK